MTQPQPPALVRLFCAIELPPEVRALAAAHAASLRACGAGPFKVSWEREEKLHITMKFFGEVAAEMIEPLSEAAGRVAVRVRPFELRLRETGVFPSPSRPHVLWLGVSDEAERLYHLQRQLEDEFARAGARRDSRPFHAHVTVARLRAAGPAERRLARRHLELGFEPSGFNAAEVVLVRSQLGPGGSVHTPLSRHEFKEAGG